MKLPVHAFERIVLAFLVLCAASGCANLRALSRADRIETRMTRELVRLYEKQGYNYFLLGYEYYTLAKEAEEAGAPASRVKDYRAKARLYYLYSQDLQEAAQEVRSGLAAAAVQSPETGADRRDSPAAGLQGPSREFEPPSVPE